jgi:uncharacterized protein DUF1264
MRQTLPALTLALLAACGGGDSPPRERTPGAPQTKKTTALEAGSQVLQGLPPVEEIEVYINGFHPMWASPGMQMESHHYCHQVNEDFAQCVLYDGNTAESRLHGVEYIISERLFEGLPPAEKRYWHPHNYEILSGQLVAPGIPEVAETELMRKKINSYGKTWHLWKTGVYAQPADPLPYGEPHLAWSFNRDGEAQLGLVESRDRRMGTDTAKKRERRRDLTKLTRPQAGVDLLRKSFPEATPITGVVDKGSPGPGR